MQGVVQVYNDLKQKGIEFPPSELETMAPIITPSRVRIYSFLKLRSDCLCQSLVYFYLNMGYNNPPRLYLIKFSIKMYIKICLHRYRPMTLSCAICYQ